MRAAKSLSPNHSWKQLADWSVSRGLEALYACSISVPLQDLSHRDLSELSVDGRGSDFSNTRAGEGGGRQLGGIVPPAGEDPIPPGQALHQLPSCQHSWKLRQRLVT